MIETLFSLFFISATLLLTASLLLSATSRQRDVERSMGGTYLADQIMARVKAEAEQTGTPPEAESGVDINNPAYRYRIDVVNANLYSPCSNRELQYLPAERRSLNDIGTQVKVTVQWDPPGPRSKAVSYGLILKKLPEIDRVEITAAPGNSLPVPKDGRAAYNATAFDTSNRPIDGIFFHWYAQPRTGNGSAFSRTRDGHQGEFVHLYNNPYRATPTYFPAGAECVLQARARFNGKELECDSPAIPLNGGP